MKKKQMSIADSRSNSQKSKGKYRAKAGIQLDGDDSEGKDEQSSGIDLIDADIEVKLSAHKPGGAGNGAQPE